MASLPSISCNQSDVNLFWFNFDNYVGSFGVIEGGRSEVFSKQLNNYFRGRSLNDNRYNFYELKFMALFNSSIIFEQLMSYFSFIYIGVLLLENARQSFIHFYTFVFFVLREREPDIVQFVKTYLGDVLTYAA